MRRRFLSYILFFSIIFSFSRQGHGQSTEGRLPEWGPKDTIIVSTINYAGEVMSYKELENVYVSNLPPNKLAKVIEKYNRLRNAVYVTYPYARTAGATLNDVNIHLANIQSKAERKKYIKTREKELKEQFTDPLTNLSVYQGKVLMKLINRQTSNNCYEIIKEYKGGLSARMYQTVAFFFGSNLRQDYNIKETYDRQIENIVKEIDGAWYNNPYKPGIRIQ
jgi:benzoyl-CoA reductase/2-hydroxyglutaryl-CoA dehydratase subunit BcrC/BadD/HgdB